VNEKNMKVHFPRIGHGPCIDLRTVFYLPEIEMWPWNQHGRQLWPGSL